MTKDKENTTKNIFQTNRNETSTQIKLESDIGSNIGSNIGNVDNSTKLSKGREPKGNVQVDISGTYFFKDSGSRDSCIIGTDVYNDLVSEYANALVGGVKACLLVLNIPGTLIDSSGKTKTVEIIGRGAFSACGWESGGYGITKKVKVPRQVKVIKFYGIGRMYDLEVFEFESGSKLEIIDDHGLHAVGFNTGNNPSKRNGTLILPSTLLSVGPDGIFQSNLFDTVIYCGSHLLNNESALEYNVLPKTMVMVAAQYTSNGNIFGRSPNKNHQIVTEVSCSILSGNLMYSLRVQVGTCRILLPWIFTLISVM